MMGSWQYPWACLRPGSRAFLAAELVGDHWKLRLPWAYTYGDATSRWEVLI